MQGIGPGTDDICRCIKIGFADFEMNNVASFRLERFCFDQNFKCRLGAKTRRSLGQPKFALCSFVHRVKQDYARMKSKRQCGSHTQPLSLNFLPDDAFALADVDPILVRIKDAIPQAAIDFARQSASSPCR